MQCSFEREECGNNTYYRCRLPVRAIRRRGGGRARFLRTYAAAASASDRRRDLYRLLRRADVRYEWAAAVAAAAARPSVAAVRRAHRKFTSDFPFFVSNSLYALPTYPISTAGGREGVRA